MPCKKDFYDKEDCIYAHGGFTWCDPCHYHPSKFKAGQVVRSKRVLIHGGWKTASVHPNDYKDVEGNTLVTAVKTWTNFYGIQVRVKTPEDQLLDVEEGYLEEV